MSKDIWHTKKEKATEDKLIFAQHKSLRDKGVDWFIWEPQEFTDATREDVIAWIYLDDLLALETELERTRKALDVAVDVLKELKPQKAKGGGYWAVKSTDAIKLINKALEQITALEQKDVK